MTAIPAVSRTIKTMADGTLRLTVDIEPTSAQDAFALFGSGNVPMALAALNSGTAIPEPEPELKGGELAKLAAMFAQSEDFWNWLRSIGQLTKSLGPETMAADMWIKTVCMIGSKRELDHDERAADRFHRSIRKPFVEWQQRNGRAAA